METVISKDEKETFFRNTLNIEWSNKQQNEEIRNRMGIKVTVVDTINKKTSKMDGHLQNPKLKKFL